MTKKNCAALPAIVPRRRIIANALVYGLSLSVRFTSATGEQVELPSLAAASVAAKDDGQISYNRWPVRSIEPIALRLAWPLVARRCHAACEPPMPTALARTCGAP
jgi:hypothetical protein